MADHRKVIINAPVIEWPDIHKAVQTWIRWYDNPKKVDRNKIWFGKYAIHETRTGTVVVNKGKP